MTQLAVMDKMDYINTLQAMRLHYKSPNRFSIYPLPVRVMYTRPTTYRRVTNILRESIINGSMEFRLTEQPRRLRIPRINVNIQPNNLQEIKNTLSVRMHNLVKIMQDSTNNSFNNLIASKNTDDFLEDMENIRREMKEESDKVIDETIDGMIEAGKSHPEQRELLVSTAQGFYGFLNGVLSDAWDFFKSIAESIKSFILESWDTIKGKVKEVYEDAKDFIEDTYDDVKDFVGGLF